MPVYEYRCNACRKVISIFQRRMDTVVAARCDRCGGADLQRLMSTFAFRKSAPGSLDEGGIDDAMMDGVDENDPRSVARWARRMSGELGEDMGPEFDDMVSRMEAGEMPGDEDDGGDFDDDL